MFKKKVHVQADSKKVLNIVHLFENCNEIKYNSIRHVFKSWLLPQNNCWLKMSSVLTHIAMDLFRKRK